MSARIVHRVKFTSRSKYARELLIHSDMKESEIAREAKITPQTVAAIKKKMMEEFGLI